MFHPDRLRALAKLLRRLSPNNARRHFDMDAWVYQHDSEDEPAPVIPSKPTSKNFLTCGTTACALGWAATIPALQAAGLRMRRRVDWTWGGLAPHHLPQYKGSTGTVAAARLFGIDQDAAEYLFAGTEFAKTPKKVALLIDKVIKNKGHCPKNVQRYFDESPLR